MSGRVTVPGGLGRARRTAERLRRREAPASLQFVGETIQLLFEVRADGRGGFAMELARTFLGLRDSPSDKELRGRLLAEEPESPAEGTGDPEAARQLVRRTTSLRL